MKVYVALLGTVLLCGGLTAQNTTPSNASLRFKLVLPSDISSETVQINYFATGTSGGYGSFIQPQAGLSAYKLSAPGTEVKVVVYMPGCEMGTLDLKADTPRTQNLECRPLPWTSLSGQIVPSDVVVSKNTEVEVTYLAFWAHEYFGIMDGMVTTFRVATVVPEENGAFTVSLPDFSHDAVSTRWKMGGQWQFILREVRTGNIVAMLKDTTSGENHVGLDVRSSYPDVVTFTAVPR